MANKLFIDRLLDSGPVELVWVDDTTHARHREVRKPNDDLSDLPIDARDQIIAHWTQERVDAWKAANAPTPEDEADFENTRIEGERISVLKADATRQQLINQLKTATPSQINNYVDNNVTDLASARTMFKRILLVLSTTVRD